VKSRYVMIGLPPHPHFVMPSVPTDTASYRTLQDVYSRPPYSHHGTLNSNPQKASRVNARARDHTSRYLVPHQQPSTPSNAWQGTLMLALESLLGFASWGGLDIEAAEEDAEVRCRWAMVSSSLRCFGCTAAAALAPKSRGGKDRYATAIAFTRHRQARSPHCT